MINSGRMLVVSDLHIGKEFGLSRSGIHFIDATRKMALELRQAYRRNRARKLILLGDIKESIGYPTREEFEAIAAFFHEFRDIDVAIVKGNHDAHLSEILRRIGMNVFPSSELIVDGIAMLHGNRMPSEAAMKKDYLIEGHSHVAVDVDGKTSKGWLVSRPGIGAAREYPAYNKRIRLVMMPAYSRLITGVSVNGRADWSMPLFRRRIFDPGTAKAYGLDGKLQWEGPGAGNAR